MKGTSEDWLGRWVEGRTGWHEPAGNAGLRKFWAELAEPGRVLVPFCGKSPDLLWLAQRGHEVVGVELSEIAVVGFFEDHDLEYEFETVGPLGRYQAKERGVTLYCGNYFDFRSEPFDALYDRAALVALPAEQRPRYVEHTNRLLRPDAARLIITLEYDQSIVNGPPFSVSAKEIGGYWDDMVRVDEQDDIDNCPPSFRKAGLKAILEVFWLSR